MCGVRKSDRDGTVPAGVGAWGGGGGGGVGYWLNSLADEGPVNLLRRERAVEGGVVAGGERERGREGFKFMHLILLVRLTTEQATPLLPSRHGKGTERRGVGGGARGGWKRSCC